MKTKSLFGILMLFLCSFCFVSCDSDDEEEGRKVTNYEEYVLTVASKQVPGVLLSEGANVLSEVYAVKKEQSEEWSAFGSIEGFEFEEGYEYKIKISATTYLDYSMGDPSWTERKLMNVISKERKASEGVPAHFIPKAYYEQTSLPEYRYAIEADNKDVIEKDLKAAPVIPLDYHYLRYRDGNGYIKGIGINNNGDVLGPIFIRSKNKESEEMPESYQLLPPNGRIVGGGEWLFYNTTEDENAFLSFDVFMGYAPKSREYLPSPNIFYLYKDLTQHYQAKYPEAGVRTVVVSYEIKVN